MSDVNDLVERYADLNKSDTFVSYNDCIVLAREVRRLRSHPPLSAEERGVLHRARNRLGSDAAYAFRAGDDVLHEQIEQESAAIDRVTGVESDADAAKLLAASETQGEKP